MTNPFDENSNGYLTYSLFPQDENSFIPTDIEQHQVPYINGFVTDKGLYKINCLTI